MSRPADAANRPELPKRGVGGPPTCPDCGAISGGNATCATCRSHWPGGDPVTRMPHLERANAAEVEANLTSPRYPESVVAGSHAGGVPAGTPESSESSPGWPLGQAPVSSSFAVSELLRRASDHISKYAWNQEGIRLIAEINSVLSKEKP